MSIFTSVACTNAAGFYLEMFLQYLKESSEDRDGSQAVCLKGFFPFARLNDWLPRNLSHRGSQTQNHELRWGGSLRNSYCVLDVFIQSHWITWKALQSWQNQHLLLCRWTEPRGLTGRMQQSASPSPFHLTLMPAFPLLNCTVRNESGAQRRRQMERWGPWGRGWWSQRSRVTDSTLMGTQEWLVARGCVLGQRQAETGHSVESQGQATTTFRRLEIKQSISFPPTSVNDSYVLLYAKIQLFFCCALISLNNWDPERLCHHPANSEKCEKQWESVAVT